MLREVGEKPDIANPRDHLELGELLGAIDVERGAKVSGSRFYYLTGVGALLQLGLLQLAIQQAVEYGLTPMITPALVKPEAMEGTGFLGAHAAEVYRLEADDLYPRRHIGGAARRRTTATRSSTSRSANRAGTPAGRRASGARPARTARTSAASSGCTSSTRWRCSPSAGPRRRTTSTCACSRGKRRCSARSTCPTGSSTWRPATSASSAARKFDCEAWLPSQQRYREVTSTSNCTTFQARRLGIRYRDDAGKTQIAATLNGTLATTRWIVAILENHQQPDGSVAVPKALQPFVGGRDVLEPVAR